MAVNEEMFQVRESLLTIALREPSHRTSFNLVVVVCRILIAATLVLYVCDTDSFPRDVAYIVQQFSPIRVSLAMEVVYLIACFFLVFFTRARVENNGKWTAAHVIGVSLVFAAVILIPMYLLMQNHVHFCLTVAILLQQLRVLMKFVSFVVENTDSADDSNHDARKGRQELPTIRSMMYFMFAPTLVYRHSYPQSPNPTDWKLVVHHFSEWLFLFVPTIVFITRFMLPVWHLIGRETVTIHLLCDLFLGCCVLYVLMAVGIGYYFVHCWSNMWAEILRFGDRQFYGNFWIAKNSFESLGKWNRVVKVWLVRYLYLPCYRKTGSKKMAGIVVLFISGIAHDYVYSWSLGFLLPIITAFFTLFTGPALLSGAMTRTGREGMHHQRNIVFFAFVEMIASVEYWTRKNCPEIGRSCLEFDFSNALWSRC